MPKKVLSHSNLRCIKRLRLNVQSKYQLSSAVETAAEVCTQKLLQLKSRARFAWVLLGSQLGAIRTFVRFGSFSRGGGRAMRFCNWRRNRAPFKVRELLRTTCFSRTARCNIESRLEDALEKESVFARFSRNFEIRAMRDPREAPPTAAVEFSRTKSFFVHRQWRKGFSGEVLANRARSLKDFLKSKFSSH